MVFFAYAAAPGIPQSSDPEEFYGCQPRWPSPHQRGSEWRMENGDIYKGINATLTLAKSTAAQSTLSFVDFYISHSMVRSLLLVPFVVTAASAATLVERQSTCACGYKDSTGAIWRESIVSDFTAAAGAEAVLSQSFEKFEYEEPHPDSPYDMNYNGNNVYAYNDGLGLKTSAYSGSGFVQTAGISTLRKNIMYGSFRMRATVPSVPGVCFGFFTYKRDQVPPQEADIEFLSSDTDYYQRLYHTNQPGLINGNTDPDASKTIVIPGADFTAFHEHRLDWLPTSTKYYYDGSLKSTVSKNSPTVESPLLVNVWSDGGPLWSRGPPTQDAIATIYYIKAYFNSSTVSESQFNANCATSSIKTPCSV